MKKTLVIGTSATLLAMLAGCSALRNDPQASVYGPAPTEVGSIDQPLEDVYGVPVDFYDDDDEDYDYDDEESDWGWDSVLDGDVIEMQDPDDGQVEDGEDGADGQGEPGDPGEPED